MRLYIEVIEVSERFAALEEEWEELHSCCPAATPFQSWAWLYSWWEYYGEAYKLRLVILRGDDGLLVGLLPLMLERRGLLGRLLFVGTGASDYLDVLVREGWEEQVSLSGVPALKEIGMWRVADLQELRPEAAAWSVLGGWAGPRLAVWQSTCPVIVVRPWEELLASLSRNLRSTTRRTLRRAEADGLRRELAGVEDAEEAAREVVALHRIAWQGRAIGSENLTRRFEEQIVTAARRMTVRGLGGVSELKQGETTMVSTFLVFGRDFVGSYMIGASQEALKRYQWSALYLWDGLNIADDKDMSRFDLLRGEEDYKMRWSSEVVTNHRLILGRDMIFWGPYTGYHTLRLKLRGYLRSERAPRWLLGAVDRYRASRSAAARGRLQRRNRT